MKRLLERLGHPLLLPIWVLAAAVLVLYLRLGTPGLWEPQEVAVADAAAKRADRVKAADAPAAVPACSKTSTDPEGTRTLTERLVAKGVPPVPPAKPATPPAAKADGAAPPTAPVMVQAAAGDEVAMRLGLCLLGILCVLATCGIAYRLGSPRAGLIAGVACLSFPLLVLQARQLTSDIGTAAGAALMLFGAVGLFKPVRARWQWRVVDVAVATASLLLGAWLAFQSGGALLGLVPPMLAMVALGNSALVFMVAGLGLLHMMRGRSPRTLGPVPWDRLWSAAMALTARIALVALLVVLFFQIYDLHYPMPGTRQVFGRSIVPSGCYSEAIGGLWKLDDNLLASFDSLFEQVSFGTYPFGVLAPIAIFYLLSQREHRMAGTLTLAWAATAWVVAQVWQRKVGFAVWSGFPAFAVAIGIWADNFLSARERADQGPLAGAADDPRRPLFLVAAFVGFAVITLGKDLTAFPEKLTSLLIGGDALKYPVAAKWLQLPLKAWILPLGIVSALLLGTGFICWRPGGNELLRRIGRRCLTAAFAMAVVAGLFWGQVWQIQLADNLSLKTVFEQYRDLRSDGEGLAVLGDFGQAPRYYAGGPYRTLANREELITLLGQPQRSFALAPAADLCALHRQLAGRTYYVLDDSNVRAVLLSNKVDGATDRNPLARSIVRKEPAGIKSRPSGPVVWDNRVELVGWTMPDSVSRGSEFNVTLYFKLRDNVSGSWKIFAHFDGGGLRWNGDHDPIRGRCATSYWQTGDYIIDTFSAKAGDFTFERRDYEVRIGFFTGTNPNWKNMNVTEAPPGVEDNADRVFLGKIRLD